MRRGQVRAPSWVWGMGWLTLGAAWLYWLFVTLTEVNEALGRARYNPWFEVLMVPATLGVWWVYVTWRLCGCVVDVQRRWGVLPRIDAPVMFACMFAGNLSIAAIQSSLNHTWENGYPVGRGRA